MVLTTMKNLLCRQCYTLLFRCLCEVRSTNPKKCWQHGPLITHHCASHWQLPRLLGTAWLKVKPAELPAVSGWYRGAKPGFSWGQICRVILAPELPVELAGGFQSNYVESWFSFFPVLAFSHPCRYILGAWAPSAFLPLNLFSGNPRENTHSLTYTSNCGSTEGRKKSLYFGWK